MWALLSLSLLLSDTMPEPLAVDVYPSTNATTFTLRSLVFDSVPEATAYRIYVTPIAPSRAANVATNFLTYSVTNSIPHLLYGQTYWLQAQTITATTQSDLSPPLVWPQQLTNFAILSMQQGDLSRWTNFGPVIVVTNAADYFRIAGSVSNNIDAYQKRE